MQTTDQGVPYYVDHFNKRTSWDPPIMSSGGMSVIASELPDIREQIDRCLTVIYFSVSFCPTAVEKRNPATESTVTFQETRETDHLVGDKESSLGEVHT